MRKFLATVVIAFLVGLALACGVTASAAPGGGAADPLVSKSWVDDYVEQQFDRIQTQLTDIRARVAALGTQIVIHIGRRDYTVNGNSRTMDTTPFVNANWRTMVPVRFVAEALGCIVDYSSDALGNTDAVFISK